MDVSMSVAYAHICKTLVVHTLDIFLLLCVCTTRVLHMFTQADLLIVNHDHSYIDGH